jgi:segregation and condensation protein A
MAGVTRQYLSYVDEIRQRNLELAAEYLLMAAMLIEIKSRMLLPPKKVAEGEEAEDEHGIDRETGWAGEFSERRRHV